MAAAEPARGPRTAADRRASEIVPERDVELAADRGSAGAVVGATATGVCATAVVGALGGAGAVAVAAGADAEALGEPPTAGSAAACFFGDCDGELDGLPRSAFPGAEPDGCDAPVVFAGSATSCVARTCSDAGATAAFRSCLGGSECATPTPLALGSAATTGEQAASPQAATDTAIANRDRRALLRMYLLIGLTGDCDITTS